MNNRLLLFGLGTSLVASLAQASMTFLPDSRHQQFLTYALATEEQTTFVLRDAKKAWVGLGGSITFAEFPDLGWRPQVTMMGTVNAGMRMDQGFLEFDTETVDTRLSVGLVHVSVTRWMEFRTWT